jgi:hypothetical protein
MGHRAWSMEHREKTAGRGQMAAGRKERGWKAEGFLLVVRGPLSVVRKV